MKQKYTYYLLLAFFTALWLILPENRATAQNKPIVSNDYAHKFFAGKINGRWKIMMTLNKRKRGKSEKNNLTGYYYYTRTKGYLRLNGTWKSNGSILAEEKVMQNGKWVKTGALAGRFDATTKRIQGTWTSADGKKSYSFEVKENYRGGLPAEMLYIDEANVLGKESPRGVTIAFLYPRIKGGEVANTINQFIKENLLKNPEQRIRKFVKQYVAFKKENEDNNAFFDEENFITIEANEKNILTLAYNQSGFTGGAHGYYNSTFYTFNLRTGKLIQMSDLLYPGAEAAIQSLIVQQIRKDAQLKPNESLSKVGIYKENPPIAKNFYFRPDGMAFYYNQYEIAPYAVGPRLTVIPYRKLKRYIKRRAGLRSYMR
ncbi:MAG TPA: hypothetical protein DCS93_05985 [Microscillaceae bacterium]|nr:hypothetical protein [Microscillaceae bacterium]